jgi:hypothetical protein
MEQYTMPILKQQAVVQSYQPYYKKGGSMTQDDRVQLLKMKNAHQKEMKELEMFYKSIFADNELLQKSLIKVFK